MNDDGGVVMIVGPTTSIAPVAGPMTGEVIIPVPPQPAPHPPVHGVRTGSVGSAGSPGRTGTGRAALAVDAGAARAAALRAAATARRRVRVDFMAHGPFQAAEAGPAGGC